jgi:quercetin dioxygenase-like cupin family protein
MKVYPLAYEASFVRPVMDNGGFKVVKFSFPKGKLLKKHKTESDILVFVLEGKILFSAEEEVEVSACRMISLERLAEHSIEALEDSLVVVVMSPSPQARSLFQS